MESRTESVSRLGEQAKFLAREVPRLLSWSEWPEAEALALWKHLESRAEEAEALVDALSDEGANEHLIEAAEILENILLDLHAAVGGHLARRGLI